MLKHASNASSVTATATATATAATTTAGAATIPAIPVPPPVPLGGGQLLRTASSINCNSNSNSNCNSNSSNNNSGSSGSGHNTPPVHATGGGANGTGTGTGTGTTTGGGNSPTPAAAALATTARNIHLRPPQPQPQPLNISALNASATSTLLNGGGRVANASNLLNIATPSTPLKPLTPLTPLTPNGNCLGNGSIHHHTYTNQHILADSSHQLQQQQQQQHHHSQQPSHFLMQPPMQSQTQLLHQPHQPTHAHHLSPLGHSYINCHNLTANPVVQKLNKPGPSPREALTSLGLLCLISLLLALLSLIFLLRISPNGREDALGRSTSAGVGANSEDFIVVYDVTLALGALSLSLNLCCLLVCAIQFLFAVKLRAPTFEGRDNQYLAKSSASRTCAVSGFFISIPVLLTGLILYTFSHFHSTPATVTSILIGVGIIFCGGAMVHNVFVWQREKTISYRGAPMGLGLSLPPPPHPHAHNLSLLSASQLPVSMPLALPVPVPHPLSQSTYHATTATSPSAAQQPMQLYQSQHACLLQPPSVTPVSPNHSHGSFNPLLSGNNHLTGGGAVNSSFLVRPATATPPTPPTPRPLVGLANTSCLTSGGREASGSVSPGMPPTLDMSNITVSLHELSTLV
ncbi:uncharacterized protein Dana_GF20272, isoform B [Drosophila ananassae]|uniref:Uncharacterized protein, isoform A n=1 Tax=Drosophila ananassae TaxID=7217 RepID=B3MQC2_DROAN|nr:rap-GAP domain-containing protein DDB_G0281809 [Drosophila ananassae]XP_014761273.1 rap-GAP domain-containing protein DDB_G0281809 [Drosophila ananassae]XP_032308944.1 rap-GAP domain-containing protein DDB_G0281809 [Drosophila ananassae]EDV44548.1 uncharacterized protein Dana_GF20272, isoform A [Drosophila ananassae]KPU81634.1 uncharacterized protein Dana_GF20272, isoform B [Drosophila ananassae]